MTAVLPAQALAAEAKTVALEERLSASIATRTFQRALRRCALRLLEAHPKAAFASLVYDPDAGEYRPSQVHLLGDGRVDVSSDTADVTGVPTTPHSIDSRLHHPRIGSPMEEPLQARHGTVWLDLLAAASRRLDPLPVLTAQGEVAAPGTPERVITDFVLADDPWDAWLLDGADSRYLTVFRATGESSRLRIPESRPDLSKAVLDAFHASDKVGDRLLLPTAA